MEYVNCEEQPVLEFVINQYVRLIHILLDESLFNTLLTESMILSDPSEERKDMQRYLSEQSLLCSASLAFSAKYLFLLICGKLFPLKNAIFDFE